ncbi:MAG: hypothetical protein M4D85_04885 [Actinomycetota bacterium]|nr:hypothetical protein [Actinomycetota bacterium]
MRSTFRRVVATATLTAAVAALASTGGTSAATAGSPPAAGTGGSPADRRDLASARAASAQFHNVDKAIAAGYLADELCVESPAGVMGYHYVKPALFGSTDPRQPAGLLYVDKPNGGKRLVGVEFIVPDADQNLATDSDRPSLFGVAFDGPMPGHFPGMPVHYDQHVWLWDKNPAGMFAVWNSSLSC